MTIIAITLITIGLSDILRRGWFARARTPLAAYVFAFLFPVLLAWAAGVRTSQDWLVLYVGIATAIAWLVTSHRATERDTRPSVPLGVLLTGLAILAFYGTESTDGGILGSWFSNNGLPGMRAVGSEALLLFLGAGLIQLSTGNTIVRLVLAHIGAIRPVGEPQPADRLRGGRLLGPMERIFILGLGLAGQVTAAGLVIAAKGLIRFPELQAQARADAAIEAAAAGRGESTAGIREHQPQVVATDAEERARGDAASGQVEEREGGDDVGGQVGAVGPRRGVLGIDELTEYFLIGSFVSWLVALATLALVWFGS